MVLHVAPLGELVLFVGVGLGWRSWLHRRRYGDSGIMLFRQGRWQGVLDAGTVVFLALVGTYATAVALGVLAPPTVTVALAGAVLAIGGTVLMAVAQLDLGASWRVGIERPARPGLVTTGWYRVCRNPIFLFMLVIFGGIVVQLDPRLAVVVLVAAYVIIRRQVGNEEDYLERTYGDAYREYARHVGRFVPGIGRLP